MNKTIAFAAAAMTISLGVGTAAAEPIAAKDQLGQTYRLNDDGTYGTVVRSDDGREFVLMPDGRWQAAGATASTDPSTEAKMTASIDAWVEDQGRDMTPGQRTTVKACIAAAVAGLAPVAKAQILQVADFERGAKNLLHEHPEMAPRLDGDLERCF
jgi:hypothetical protein